MDLKVVSLNTESGCRPGFHDYLQQYIKREKPDVIALQEVHSAFNARVPLTFMPGKPGKRIHPQRLWLYQELCDQYHEEYELMFAPHIYGLHDCEQGEHEVAFGQVTMVRRQTWRVTHAASGLIFRDEYCFNTEHEMKTGGLPSSKAAISTAITSQESGYSVLITNVHGFWMSRGKIDIPERFVQNCGIVQQMARIRSAVPSPLILCVGDLNYRSDMQVLEHLRSQPVFGESGRVLNHDFEIERTRTDHYANWEKEPEADFMIASSELADKTVYLKAHLNVPSDHALLAAKFKIT